jgi:hypothetical protein
MSRLLLRLLEFDTHHRVAVALAFAALIFGISNGPGPPERGYLWQSYPSQQRTAERYGLPLV